MWSKGLERAITGEERLEDKKSSLNEILDDIKDTLNDFFRKKYSKYTYLEAVSWMFAADGSLKWIITGEEIKCKLNAMDKESILITLKNNVGIRVAYNYYTTPPELHKLFEKMCRNEISF